MSGSDGNGKKMLKIDSNDQIRFRLDFKPKWWQRLARQRFGQGKSDDPNAALTRPFRQLVTTGRPIGKINYIFFKGNKWPSKVLGTICFTPGKRFLFFPGLSERKINWIQSSDGRNFSLYYNYGQIDHFTLNEDMKTWHTTIIESTGKSDVKLPSHKTLKIGEAIFWFGLTLSSPEVLETTPEEQDMIFSCPPKDSERRVKLLMDAREGSIYHLVNLPPKVLINDDEFLHIDFFIAPPNMDTRRLPCHVPMSERIIRNYSQVEGGTPFRFHPVMLPGVNERFWVAVSKHKGRPTEKSIVVTL